MMGRAIAVAAALAALGGAPCDAQGQSPQNAAEQQEVALARSAAPAVISDSADVLVLRDTGYALAVRGTTGAACLVTRPRAGSVVPVCYDPRAARALVPAERMAQQLRAAGRSAEAVDSAIEAAFRASRLPMPIPGSIGWMMSPKQVFVGASGNAIGA
jgi:hypothetical protein